jgi:tellurium resistance protein TerD
MGMEVIPQFTHFIQEYRHIHTDTLRNVTNIVPTMDFTYKFSKLSQLRINYHGTTSQPSITDLLDITDDSNPLNIRKGNPGLKNIMVGLGWDVNAFDSGVDFDLDAAAFMLGADGKCPTDKEFVFYGNLAHPSESVKHMGDNLTGEGEGDDEQIQIDLSKVPANIERIAFTVTIYEAEARRQNFGQVSNSFIRLVDETTGKEMIRYDLGEDFSIETAVVVGELYRHNGEWKFNAIGSGFQGGLAALCGHYGIEVA